MGESGINGNLHMRAARCGQCHSAKQLTSPNWIKDIPCFVVYAAVLPETPDVGLCGTVARPLLYSRQTVLRSTSLSHQRHNHFERPPPISCPNCIQYQLPQLSYVRERFRQQESTYSVSSNLFPVHLLSRHRQLSPQTLEAALSQLIESSVQLFLELVLRLDHLLDDLTRTSAACRNVHILVCAHTHVSILIIVYVCLDRARQRRR